MTSLKIRMFGPFIVEVEEAALPTLRTRKGSWLLALLVLRHAGPIDRVWLAATLWPDSDHAESLKNLRDSLYDLRKALGTQAKRLHSPTPGTLALDLAGTDVDLPLFDTLVAQRDDVALDQAIGLYRGSLLEGCHEEWVVDERARRHRMCVEALEARAAMAMEQAASTSAAQYLRTCIRLEPLSETAHCKLMTVLENLGDYAEATRLYREFRLRLHDELQSTPASETTALYEQIRVRARQLASLTPPSPVALARSAPTTDISASSVELFPPSHFRSDPPHNLPPSLTSFLGREREIAEITSLLQIAPLLTLTGAGGVGKTRTALQVAARVREEFSDGIWLVELDALSEPDLVLQAVADVLCLREQPENACSSNVRVWFGPSLR